MSTELKNVMDKLDEIKGQTMTMDALEARLEEFKGSLLGDSPEVAELKSTIEALKGDIAELKTDPTAKFATSQEDEELKRGQEIFERFCKKGKGALTAEEIKLMTSNDDTTGGYLAGRQLDSEVIKDIREMNSMMTVAQVKQTSSKVYSYVKVENVSKAGTKQEGKAGENKDVKVGRVDINTYTYSHNTYVTDEDIEDAEISITQIITDELGEGIAEGCEDDFFIGDGVNKPQGILVNTDIEQVETEGSGTFIDEDIITLNYSLKKAYRKNMTWFANRKILGYIAKMKSTDGRFQFSTEPLERYPNSIGTLMNRPVYEAPSMAETVAAGNIVLSVGDFKKGYVVVERVGTTVKRDDMTMAEEGIVKFIGRKRLGGQTKQPEAIKHLKVKA
jgi:HK97 family phage major capsid protein